MNRKKLIDKISDNFDTKKDASKAIDAVFSTIESALQKGEDFSLVGFGSFKVIKRKKRKGRNPQTGEEIIIPAKKVVKFIPGKKLKESINK
jgi:DNA-binding protein HU-beta